MKTEDEARKCWCPFMREEDVAPANRCVASECMAWRWYDPHKAEDDALINEEMHGRPHGYCGLAGKP